VPPVHAVVRDAGDAAMVAKMAPAYAAAAGAGARTARVVVAVYSLTGGVGKSTICAHLARTLYGSGEQVLLVDPSGRAMLPAFFGSHEERDGLRKFCAPGETHASVLVATREGGDVAWLREEVGPLMAAVDRTIVDLGGAAPAVVEEVLTIAQLLLIPVVPGPQAAATVGRVTAWLEKLRARGAHSPRVYYLMNRVDEQRESDRRTVEGMREICGEALAPVALAESEEVEYAFAERMTVSDFHTTAPLALQYEKLASWMRKLLPPSTPPPARRWSEV
jgi:cellulose biosynthesis protein BcsQ